MRILMWEQVRRELESNAAFNMALLRAIDPRLITHRPRDPEKARLMAELGMETSISTIARRSKEMLAKQTEACEEEPDEEIEVDFECEPEE
jgi:hypothetical protein